MSVKSKIQALIDAVNAKTGKSDADLTAAVQSLISESGGDGVSEVEWHQCPTAVKEYLDNVTYNPDDYSTSQIANYAPDPAVSSNTKPIGKTVDGVTYYNEVPNVATPFSSANEAGTVKPLDRLRWLNTTVALATGGAIYPKGVNTRDLGGWACDGGTVKYGMLVRGGEPNEVDKDLMMNIVGIKSELYLLPVSEQKSQVSAWGVDMYYNPTQNDFIWYDIQHVELWRYYLRVVFDSITHGKPLYFHCGIGADRTGTIAVMLLALLGVSQSDIDKDYELTNFYVVDPNSPRRRDVLQYKNYISAIKAVPLVGGLTDSFQNRAVSFALSLGLTADEINAFRIAMIDGNPSSISPEIDTFSVANTLAHATSDNNAVSADEFQPYEANITAGSGYVIESVQVTMNGVDITGEAWSGVKTNLNYGITNTLSYCMTDNNRKYVIAGQMFFANITAEQGYTLEGATISITMGGVDVSTQYYSEGKISIPNVTGNIVISITATPTAPPYTNLADPSSADWKDGYRLNSSGSPVAESGKTVCNFIPCEQGDVIYIKGTPSFDTGGADRITILSSSKTSLDTQYSNVYLNNPTSSNVGYMRKISGGYYEFHITSATAAYLRASFNTPSVASDIIITRNEPIT